MKKSSVASMFIKSLAIDLGTVNTLIAMCGRGIAVRETSAVAIGTKEGDDSHILAVGNSALKMLGRTPGGINIVYPMRDGVVADHEMTETMLKYYITRALGHKVGALGIRLMMCLPMCVTSVEKRALIEAARGAGAREVMLMDEPLAAAIGAQLPVDQPIGSMIVDIGGGTTDIAVVALNGIAAAKSIRLGGTHIDDAICCYIQKKYGMIIGTRTAEDIKRTIGCAVKSDAELMQVRGRNIESGLPCSVTVSTIEIYSAILPLLKQLVDAVVETLSITPPELAGDILTNGIVLCGGGALLNGIDTLISHETGIEVKIDENPLDCVIRGALYTLEKRYTNDDEVYSAAIDVSQTDSAS